MNQNVLRDLKSLDLQIYRSIATHPALSTLEDMELYTSEHHIRLRGKVSSYFEKQLIQEAIRDHDKSRAIENEVTVDWV